MKNLKSKFHTVTVVLALGSFLIGISPANTLASSYDATAEFTFTLNSVVDESGALVTSGWEVFAAGYGDVFAVESGDASATGSVNVIDPAVYLGIGSSITQTSSSSGEAIDGLATTDALTDLEISFDNFLDQTLIFSFEYDIYLETLTTGEAESSASVDMLDNLGLLDVQAYSEAVSGPTDDDSDSNTASLYGQAQFELSGGEFNFISGFVDTFGSAFAESVNVPEPFSILLLATGLAGVGFASRKKR